MIEIKEIKKSFGNLEVLKGVSFSVESGEMVAIVGGSGAGKTTLLQIMGTLMCADSGQILLEGEDILKLSNKKIDVLRNTKMGFTFQFHHLLPEFTALENVMIPALIGNKSVKESKSKALSLLEYLGVENRKSHKPSELSGGEQQRVAIARALINDPSVLLADEPSGNLDSANKEELHKLLFQLKREKHQTIVLVTHDLELSGLCDKVIQMKDGMCY